MIQFVSAWLLHSIYSAFPFFLFLPSAGDVRAITFLRRKWRFRLDLLYCVKHPCWLTTCCFFPLFLCRICLTSISIHAGWGLSFIVVFRVGGWHGMFTCLHLAHMLWSPCKDLVQMLRFICSSTSIAFTVSFLDVLLSFFPLSDFPLSDTTFYLPLGLDRWECCWSDIFWSPSPRGIIWHIPPELFFIIFLVDFCSIFFSFDSFFFKILHCTLRIKRGAYNAAAPTPL
jgi:hypothetical protein